MDCSGILYLLEKHAPKPRPRLPEAMEIKIAAAKQVLKKKHGNGWRVPDYAIRTIKEEYDRTCSLERTGAVFGMGKSGIGKLLKRRGIPARKNGQDRLRQVYNGTTYIFDGKRYWYQMGKKGKGIHLHRVVWEGRHGPVPPAHYLIFLTDDRNDFSDSNLKLMPRKEGLRWMLQERWKKYRQARAA